MAARANRGPPEGVLSGPLAYGGAAAIAGTGIPGWRQAVAYLIFALIGTLGVGTPVTMTQKVMHVTGIDALAPVTLRTVAASAPVASDTTEG